MNLRPRVKDTIYLVTARRGDYSDRTEYAVCWFATEREAKTCAELFHEKSLKWRRRLSDSDEPWSAVEKAQADIGDSQWGWFDDTTYGVHALERGAL